MHDREDFLRELNHRVRNNFQIIASLMSLQKRLLPPERRSDLRFIEEHVQSMAVAYRAASVSSEMAQIPIDGLIRETGDNLRQIAGARPDALRYDLLQDGAEIELNQGIVLGLYIAVVLPPHLDHVVVHGGVVQIRSATTDGKLFVSISGAAGTPVTMDLMRMRLIDAYVRQLRGDTPEAAHAGELSLRFPLDPPRVEIAGRAAIS